MESDAFDKKNALDWRKLDFAREFESPYLIEIFDLWKSKCRDGKLPARPDFLMEDLAAFGGRIALIDVEQNPERFRFRLVGTWITDMIGRDSTGKYVDELYDEEHYNLAVEGYRYCVLHKAPAPAQGRMVHADKEFVKFEAVDLPLADDGETVNVIMKAADAIEQ